MALNACSWIDIMLSPERVTKARAEVGLKFHELSHVLPLYSLFFCKYVPKWHVMILVLTV